MDIQFHHNNRFIGQKKTMAVLLPNAEEFAALLENETREITLAVGIAYCSPKDNYCKKTGREIAINRMKPATHRLTSMHFTDSGEVYFVLAMGRLSNLKVKMNAKSSRLHLIEAY